ncbi:MAG: hypothetical protein GW903_07930 [Alphaproteobacteria bacterium]|nr:hypothetical protein [Alphaproteobacteria bacterium]NCQ89189.1 hypothetical protein [Alphaproteobacteria bacterium]
MIIKNTICSCTFILILVLSCGARAEIFISKKLGIILPTVSATVSAGQLKWFPLSVENPSENGLENYEITVTVNSIFPDIDAYVCDEPNLNLMINRQRFSCFGTAKGNETFQIQANRYSPHTHYLVFSNSYSLFTDKDINAHIYVTKQFSDTYREELKASFTGIINDLNDLLKVPDFDISLTPCKRENAFSTISGGHITICSELVFGIVLDGNHGAFASIFLHELGHTLLNLWGLPDYKNERTADEFAVAIMLMDRKNRGESHIYDWVNWFRKHQNIEGEIAAMLTGGQHPLTAQRISAIEQILASRGDFLRRWANVLYPRMTNKALYDIISNPYAGANVDLAESILEARKK